jgi:acetolactate synthase-1/2/3 large subunit
VDRALAVLAGARRPVLLIGRGAATPAAARLVRGLGDRLGALVATTLLAAGTFAGDLHAVGVCGGFSSPRTAELLRTADVVVALGAGLNEWTLDGGRLPGPEATLVQVDLAAPTCDRVDLPVRGDVVRVVGRLLAGLGARQAGERPWRAEVAAAVARADWRHQPFRDAGTADRIDPRTLSLALLPLLPPDRTLVCDGGHFVTWPLRYWPVDDPAAFVFPGVGFQSVGLGTAGAVGAALARPDRTVVLAVGDGGALMGLADLETLVRVVPSALVVVYDDAAYGAEAHMYRPFGIDLAPATFRDTDFAGVARSLGASAVTVRRAAHLAPVRAWADGGRAGVLVLDCKVVPDVVADYLVAVGPAVKAGTVNRVIEEEPCT